MNTQEWLTKILSSKEELHHWLERQYIGEVTAAERIENLPWVFILPKDKRITLYNISADERKHAKWVKGLLEARSIPIPEIKNAEDRYWKPVLEGSTDSFEELTAAGHHAEGMRLVRIRALADCEGIDQDIRDVFKRILPDEIFHEKAFGGLSTPEALEKMSVKHQEGLRLLGLEI